MENTRLSAAAQRAENQEIIDQLFDADVSIQKKASDRLSEWLRTYQRQDGIFRKIMPPTPVTDADFDVAVDTNAPFIIRQMVPKSAGAISVNYDTGTFAEEMDAPRYRIFMQRIWTPKYRADKIYLVSFRGSLVDVFHDLMLQDILAQEDQMGVGLCNYAVGEKSVINPEIGCRQYINVGASITTQSVQYAVKGMVLGTNNLNPSQALVHRSFWFDLIATFRADTQGRTFTEPTLFGRIGALEERLAGISWKTALDRGLIPMKAMYIFAEPQYCGDFVTYGEASIFTNTIDDTWIEMHAHETIGMSIPNAAAVFRADFKGSSQDNWLDEDDDEEEGTSSASE